MIVRDVLPGVAECVSLEGSRRHIFFFFFFFGYAGRPREYITLYVKDLCVKLERPRHCLQTGQIPQLGPLIQPQLRRPRIDEGILEILGRQERSSVQLYYELDSKIDNFKAAIDRKLARIALGWI